MPDERYFACQQRDRVAIRADRLRHRTEDVRRIRGLIAGRSEAGKDGGSGLFEACVSGLFICT